MECFVDNKGSLLRVDAVIRNSVLSGEIVLGGVAVAAQDRISAQASCKHGHQWRRAVIGQNVRAPGTRTVRHRDNRDLVFGDAGRQFRSSQFVVHPAHPIRLRMISRIALMPDPLARTFAGFPKELPIHFHHAVEIGCATIAEGANDLLTPSPDAHLVKTERRAHSSQQAAPLHVQTLF